MNADGTITYSPNADYNGVDDFNYQVCNDLGYCSNATVIVVVTAVNDPPLAQPDAATTPEETSVVVDVLINDSEPIDNPGDVVAGSVVITVGPANGVATVGLGGTIDYTPAIDFNGTDTVTYTVCDDGFPLPGACDTALVVFQVTPVNDHPVIAGDTLQFVGNEDLALLICVPTSDVDGDTLDITSVVSGPFSGAVSGVADGDTCVLYTPDPDFFGNDTLIVNVCDPDGACDQAVIVISILPANDPAVIIDGIGLPADTVLASTAEETPVTICLDALDIDGDPVQVTDFFNGPFNGFVSGFADGDTCFTYTPNVNYNGGDTVSIVVCDGFGGCDTVAVVIDVTPVNDAPVIEDGNGGPMDTLLVTTPEDTPINLCLPVSDAEGDPVDVTTYFNGPVSGSIFNILDGNPCFTYAPDANYNGPDTVSVVVSDGNGGNDTLVVIIDVLPVNDVPVIVDGGGIPIDTVTTTTAEDTPITICLDAIDADGDTLDIVDILNGPGNGLVTGLLAGDTCFTYSTAVDWSGTDTMTVVVCDNNNGCDSITVVIYVTPVNDDPVIVDNGGSPIDTLDIFTAVDQPVTICLDAIDVDGDTLDAVTIFNGPDSGSVSGVLDGDTCFTYTPNAAFEGTDTMTVVVEDGIGGADTVVVIVNVTPNQPPVADSDTVNVITPEDTPILICISATDPDGDPLDVTAVLNGPTNGAVIGLLDGDTCFTYVPALDWSGVDTVVVTVCDQFNDCDEVTVIVTVTPVNDVPVITDGGLPIDSLNIVTPEDTPIVICLNAIDADGDTLDVVSVVNGPLNGQVVGTLNGDTCFTYIPNADWNGSEIVSVVVCDDNGGCDTMTVTIGVIPVDDAPVITDGGAPVDTINVTTPQDIPVTSCLDAIDADGDTLDVVEIIDGPDSGVVTGVLDGDTCFTYTPNAGYFGPDTLTAVVCDGTGSCDTVVVVITVTEVIPNQPPIAVDDTAATLEDTSVAIDIQDNDSDPDGDPLTTTGAVAGNGTVTINGNGSITYVPDPGWCGTDTITYTVCDPFGLCDDAIVIVDVACVNAPPIAVDDNAATTPGVVITIAVLDNDSDPDGDPITVINASAANGSVLVNGDGSITYTPNVGFCGTDTLTYTISDGNGGTDTAIVIIDVPCPNEPPIAVDDYVVIDGDQAVIYVLGNDSDPDGDPIEVTSASALNGTVSINGDGTVNYSPDPGFCGWDTITYIICDPQPLCDEGVVVLEVVCPDNTLLIPQGFSPNGDGIADTWVIQNLDLYPGASVIIFNRWGNEVFNADPYLNDWTGVSQHALTVGDVLPAGTYWYLLDLGVEGEEVRSGYIYLNK
ncbi:MAG: tandem-95 repeat protein [Flavobacteriales bacterium]|nr:tandem-95 repeat protein [Flavobacteriales bacterium]